MQRNKLLVGIAATGFSLLLASNAFAGVWPGFYVGAQGGWGQVHGDGVDTDSLRDIAVDVLHTRVTVLSSSTKHKDDGGWAGRVYGGYQFDCHWAAEFGWSKWQDFDSHGNITATDAGGNAIAVSGREKTKSDAFDLVAKGMWPVAWYAYNFNLYAKLGVAYLREHRDLDATFTNNGVSTAVNSRNHREDKVLPTFGLGVAYDLTPNVSADVAWNRIQKVDNHSRVGSTDMVTAGLAYNFG